MDDDVHKQMVFERNRKSKGVAYLFWLFTGWFGGHRFYAGKTKSAAVQLILTLTGVGFLVTFFWWLADSILIPGMVNERNFETLQMIRGPVRGPNGARLQDEEPRPAMPQLDQKREAMLSELRSTGYKKERSDPSGLY